jgi:hypothetical protein
MANKWKMTNFKVPAYRRQANVKRMSKLQKKKVFFISQIQVLAFGIAFRFIWTLNFDI